MNLTIDRETLKHALQLVTKVISANPVIPIYSNVLLEVTKDTAKITATDLEVTTLCTLKGIEGVPFTTAVPAKLFSDLISNFRDSTVTMQYDAKLQTLDISTKHNKNKVKCLDPGDFVTIQSVGKKRITIPAKSFKEAVNRVSFSASADPNKTGTVLGGVLLTIEDGKLIMCAVDGFHLSYEEIQLKEANMEMYAIVRASNLDMIARIVDENEQMKISDSENQLRIHCGSIDMTVQKINGKFPDYKVFKPATTGTIVSTSTVALFQAFKQLELFTDIAAKISIEGMMLNLSAVSKERGNSDIQIISNISGKPIEVGINVQYAKQILGVISTQEVVITFESPDKPIVFRMKDFDAFYHIIMPFSLGDL